MNKEQRLRANGEMLEPQIGGESNAEAMLRPRFTGTQDSACTQEETGAGDDFRKWLLHRYSVPFAIAPPNRHWGINE